MRIYNIPVETSKSRSKDEFWLTDSLFQMSRHKLSKFKAITNCKSICGDAINSVYSPQPVSERVYELCFSCCCSCNCYLRISLFKSRWVSCFSIVTFAVFDVLPRTITQHLLNSIATFLPRYCQLIHDEFLERLLAEIVLSSQKQVEHRKILGKQMHNIGI